MNDELKARCIRFSVHRSSLTKDSVPERRAARNLFEGFGQLAVGLGFERHVGHRDDAAQVPLAVYDGEAAHLPVAHLPYRLDDAVVRAYRVEVFRHQLLGAHSARVAALRDGAYD